MKGFTLIELMISVAIIGILVGVAVPAYENYSGKSRFSEIIQASGSIKISIEICAQVNGGLDDCTIMDNAIAQAISGAVATPYTGNVIWENSSLTMVAVNSDGLHEETYILTAEYINGIVNWTMDNASSCLSAAYCQHLLI